MGMYRAAWIFGTVACLAGCAGAPERVAVRGKPEPNAAWRGVHISAPDRTGLPMLKRLIVEALAPAGVNVLVLEVDYQFAFASHPELNALGENAITKADARELAALCREHGIRLIPQFNCLGHQSWATATGVLLAKYPELDETPWLPADNKGIYCRSWCPLHPNVNEIVFALMDEIIDAFEADAFHVGMDEVFLIADSRCPRCQGKNPAELFAKAVNDYHDHLVGEKKVTMLMWGDRLIDHAVMKYNKYESSDNGAAPAVNMIPRDIILCDWHYGKLDAYPSIPFFIEKGFRVWPSSWNRKDAALALLECAAQQRSEKMIGHLCTTWVSAADFARALLGEGDPATLSRDVTGAAEAFRACMKRMNP